MTEAPRLPVTCPHYDPLPGARRCRHYLPNGACDRPDEFLCVEWLKVNGPRDAPPPPAGERERPPSTNALAAPEAADAPGAPPGERGETPGAAPDEPASQAGRYAPVWWEMFGKGPPRPAAAKRRLPPPPAPAAPPPEPALPTPLASANDVTALA